MKVYAQCIRCLEKDPSSSHIYQGNIDDDRILTFECSSSHQAVCVDEKFDIFYDASTKDYFSGNFESTVLFSHAAYESHILFLLNALLYDTAANNEITKIRNAIQKPANKALGAFLSIFIFRVGKAPMFLKGQPYYELRNKIIHNARIPTQREAKDYLKAVYETISFNQTEVRKLVGEQQKTTKFANYFKGVSKIKSKNFFDVYTVKSPFQQEEIIDFTEYFEIKKKINLQTIETMQQASSFAAET